MAAAFDVVSSDSFPLVQLERLMAQQSVGVFQSILQTYQLTFHECVAPQNHCNSMSRRAQPRQMESRERTIVNLCVTSPRSLYA